MVHEIPIKPRQRWEIIFEENGRWRCGVYVPEHSALFLLIRGRIVLLLSKDGRSIVEKPMEEGKIYIVEEWHNAYRPGGCEGVALVIERMDIKTEYVKIGTS